MKKTAFHRSFLPVVLVLMAVAASWATFAQVEAQSGEQADTGPKVIAVKFHADWCGYCKAMGGVFEEMQAKFDQQPVLWVTFDQTRENNRKQSGYLAHALGLDDIWAEHGGKTGFILLLDAQTLEVTDTLSHELSLKEMGARLVEVVEFAS